MGGLKRTCNMDLDLDLFAQTELYQQLYKTLKVLEKY